MSVRRDEWQRLAPGLGAIAVVCGSVLWMSSRTPGAVEAPRLAAFLATVAAFTVAFVVLIVRPPAARGANALVAAQSALALLANWLIPMVLPGVALTGILLAVAASAFAALPRRVAVACIAAQTALLFVIYVAAHDWLLGIAVLAAIAYGVMQVVLESTQRLATLERARRVELEGAMRELRSTQAMLAETTRADQRSEIARNLHDVVGHQLVALGLQLDAAGAAASTGERTRLAESRELVRATLASVREVVAGLRDTDVVDLATALRSLATDGPGPRVVVHVDDAAPRMALDLAETLLRCAQEALTNARKHADAHEVDIELRPDRLTIRDDGRGIGAAPPGFGLQSMRARCSARGCDFSIDSSPQGTQITIRWDTGAGGAA
jgi:signal transduction histidine kinase